MKTKTITNENESERENENENETKAIRILTDMPSVMLFSVCFVVSPFRFVSVVAGIWLVSVKTLFPTCCLFLLTLWFVLFSVCFIISFGVGVCVIISLLFVLLFSKLLLVTLLFCILSSSSLFARFILSKLVLKLLLSFKLFKLRNLRFKVLFWPLENFALERA